MATTGKGKALSKQEIELRKKNRELEKQLEDLKKAQEQAKADKSKEEIAQSPQASTANEDVIKQMQEQIESLTRQMKYAPAQARTGPKELEDYFRPVEPEDVLPDDQEVTYIARKILYIIPSYKDSKGITRYPPHKIIKFKYAASHIQKNGREETIKNYCQFNTKLKSEIEFLNNHPLFGITFSSNLNHMMNEDVKDTDFKVMAASALGKLPPEEIIRRARKEGIDDHRKSAEELKTLLVHKLAKEYKEAESHKHAERLRRNLLVMADKENN